MMNKHPDRREGGNQRRASTSRVDAPQPEHGDRPRRREIERAAYQLIAERGFEGLRTREVALRVGINSATLHYYFPDKEALVAGVVDYLIEELSKPRVSMDPPASAVTRLLAEFSDIKVRLRDSPEQLVVLTELYARAWRDAKIAKILRRLDEGWHAHLVSILKCGIQEGTFHKDLDADAAAHVLMNQLRGLGFRAVTDRKSLNKLLDDIARQTEYWIRTGPGSRRRG